jgi:hypothetical protein
MKLAQRRLFRRCGFPAPLSVNFPMEHNLALAAHPDCVRRCKRRRAEEQFAMIEV